MPGLSLPRGLVGAGIATLLTSVLALGVSIPSVAAAPLQCPSGGTPAPGSTVTGGLEVSGGGCILQNVTVQGNVVVDTNAGLELENSTVTGNITVQPNAELDVGHQLSSNVATFTANTIDGNINYQNGNDFDLTGATIHGSVTITANQETGAEPSICGSRINGSVTIRNVTTVPLLIGDPGEPSTANGEGDCPGNIIGGSVTFANDTTPIIMEANTVAGSVSINNSAIEFAGNSAASLRCGNGGSLASSSDDTNQGNTIRGSNTCVTAP